MFTEEQMAAIAAMIATAEAKAKAEGKAEALAMTKAKGKPKRNANASVSGTGIWLTKYGPMAERKADFARVAAKMLAEGKPQKVAVTTSEGGLIFTTGDADTSIDAAPCFLVRTKEGQQDYSFYNNALGTARDFLNKKVGLPLNSGTLALQLRNLAKEYGIEISSSSCVEISADEDGNEVVTLATWSKYACELFFFEKMLSWTPSTANATA